MYIKPNINTLDNVELKYNTIILLNNQTNEKENGLGGFFV